VANTPTSDADLVQYKPEDLNDVVDDGPKAKA
jgi:hypothetical protein